MGGRNIFYIIGVIVVIIVILKALGLYYHRRDQTPDRRPLPGHCNH